MPGHSTAIPALALALTLSLAGCGDRGGDVDAGNEGRTAGDSTGELAERPAIVTDTIALEGMPEPMELRLHRAQDDFPLPFSTYVPADMSASIDPEDGTAHFTAEFGGVRNDDAFVHLFVFPPGTPRQEAIALARGYDAGHGVLVSQGVEPFAGDVRPPDLAWATEAFRFRYQSGGNWYGGDIGVGEHRNRHYMLVRHYPVEYGDGFGPRAHLIVRTWLWGDGSRLVAEGR